MAWSHVQSASAHSNATTCAATFSSNVTTGNKYVAVFCSSSATINGFSDGTNTLTALASITNSGAGVTTYLYALDIPAGIGGTAPTITVTVPSTAFNALVIQEISGLLPGNTSAMLDGTAGTGTGTGTSTTSPTYSSTALNEYLVIGYGDTGGIASITATGYTADAANQTSSPTADCCIFYKNSTNGSETSVVSMGASTSYAQITVAFKLAAGIAVQPWATIPVPRRRLIRVRWEGGQGQAFVAVPAPLQEFRLAPRRKLLRAIWHGGSGQAYLAVPPPLQQPRPAPRRKLARAYVRFTPVVTTNAALVPGPAGTVPVLMANQTRLLVRRDGRVARR